MFDKRLYDRIIKRDGYCHWTRQLPWEHRNLYMTRPQRRREKLNCRLIADHGVDPDELLWPTYHKPVVYYW